MTTAKSSWTGNLGKAFVIASSSTWNVRQLFRRFVFHRDVDESERGAAESFVFAEDQGQVAADLRVGDGNGGQRLGANIFLDVGARDEADADVGGYKALQEFAGIEFHGEVRFQTALVK